MNFRLGERVRGFSSRTTWKGIGTVMWLNGDQVTILEDEKQEGSNIWVMLSKYQITPIAGRRGDELMRRPAWHTDILRTMRLTGESEDRGSPSRRYPVRQNSGT